MPQRPQPRPARPDRPDPRAARRAVSAGAVPAARRFSRSLAACVRRAGIAHAPGPAARRAFGELGPSFIKLGQLLSTRADLFGEEITADLAQLQDRLPPFPGREARGADRGRIRPARSTRCSQSFDETAGRRRIDRPGAFRADDATGSEVAVKVLRPGIAEAFARDLDLFLWLAELGERLQPALRRLKPVEVVETLAEVGPARDGSALRGRRRLGARREFRRRPGFSCAAGRLAAHRPHAC